MIRPANVTGMIQRAIVDRTFSPRVRATGTPALSMEKVSFVKFIVVSKRVSVGSVYEGQRVFLVLVARQLVQ